MRDDPARAVPFDPERPAASRFLRAQARAGEAMTRRDLHPETIEHLWRAVEDAWPAFIAEHRRMKAEARRLAGEGER